ncbi:MAG TPA: phospholipase [Acidimicrobiia bacterium]
MNAHRHLPFAEPKLPPSRQGTVVLDIGNDVGALVVHATEDLCGREVELTHPGETAPFVHTDVRERQLPGGSVYAGVFPELAVGSYTVLGRDGNAHQDVTIASGTVTEITI